MDKIWAFVVPEGTYCAECAELEDADRADGVVVLESDDWKGEVSEDICPTCHLSIEMANG